MAALKTFPTFARPFTIPPIPPLTKLPALSIRVGAGVVVVVVDVVVEVVVLVVLVVDAVVVADVVVDVVVVLVVVETLFTATLSSSVLAS